MTAIESFHQDQQSKPILLIGDLIIDRTIYCTVSKVSPEAPVPVAMIEPNGIVETPGGAGLAASYALKNNIHTVFITACNSKWAEILGLEDGVYQENNVRKTRYVDTHSNYHLLRADTDLMIEKTDTYTNEFCDLWRANIISLLAKKKVSGVVILDYCKGLLDNEKLVQELIRTARQFEIPVYVDSRSGNLIKYTGANIIKVNTKEFSVASNALNISSAWQLSKKLELDHVIITHGKYGAEIFSREEGSSRVSCRPDLSSFNGAPDVTGCGDVFDVTFCSNWCIKGLSINASLCFAVQEATEFAYKPIEERLHVNTKRKDK